MTDWSHGTRTSHVSCTLYSKPRRQWAGHLDPLNLLKIPRYSRHPLRSPTTPDVHHRRARRSARRGIRPPRSGNRSRVSDSLRKRARTRTWMLRPRGNWCVFANAPLDLWIYTDAASDRKKPNTPLPLHLPLLMTRLRQNQYALSSLGNCVLIG